MIQEDKLLLKDLCARLPYGVICNLYDPEDADKKFKLRELSTLIISAINSGCIKPYLRTMSSMTEEEKEELKQEHIKDEKLYAECLTRAANGDNSMHGKVIPHFAADWCNKNHFDYCGLIPMGLALEAPKDMYKTE